MSHLENVRQGLLDTLGAIHAAQQHAVMSINNRDAQGLFDAYDVLCDELRALREEMTGVGVAEDE